MEEKIKHSSGMLSDEDIKNYFGKEINIFTSEKKGDLAFNLDEQLQLGSIDLRFRHECKRIKLTKDDILDYTMLKKHNYTEMFELTDDEKLIIEPGEIILTTTLEIVNLSEKIAGILTGRSSIARLGVMVHCCQSFINPGHGQSIPLQIINLGPSKVELDLKVPICQLILFELKTPSSQRYIHQNDAKYKDEITPINSKIYEESEDILEKDRSYRGNNKKNKRKESKIIKSLNKYLVPFLPSIIMILIISPFIDYFIIDNTINDLLKKIINFPLPIIVGLILLLLYIYCKQNEGEK